MNWGGGIPDPSILFISHNRERCNCIWSRRRQAAACIWMLVFLLFCEHESVFYCGCLFIYLLARGKQNKLCKWLWCHFLFTVLSSCEFHHMSRPVLGSRRAFQHGHFTHAEPNSWILCWWDDKLYPVNLVAYAIWRQRCSMHGLHDPIALAVHKYPNMFQSCLIGEEYLPQSTSQTMVISEIVLMLRDFQNFY